MGGNDNGFGAGHFANGGAYLMFLVRVEPVGRLIHNQNIRVMHDGLGKPHAAAKPFRQCVDWLVQHAVQFRHVNRPVRRASGGGFVQPANSGHEIQELARRHIGPGRSPFGQISHGLLGTQRLKANVDAVNQRRAGGWAQITGNHFHAGGFAGPIRPQKAQHLPAFHRKTDIVYGAEIAEIFGQVQYINHGL